MQSVSFSHNLDSATQTNQVIDDFSDTVSNNSSECESVNVNESYFQQFVKRALEEDRRPYYQKIYNSMPSILSAVYIISHMEEISMSNAIIASGAYLSGDIILPVIIASHGLDFLYKNYFYNKF